MKSVLINVRNESEIEELGRIPHSINIPLDSLRSRLGEISKEKNV